MSVGPVQSRCCTPHLRPIIADTPLASLSEVISRKAGPAILGGNDSVKGYSIFCAEPLETFNVSLNDPNPLDKLLHHLSAFQLKGSEPFFCGGWIGYFSYELGRAIEKLPGRAVDDLNLPLIHLAFYDKAILYDHEKDQYILAVLEIEGKTEKPESKFQTLQQWLSEAAAVNIPNPSQVNLESIKLDDFQSNMSREHYFNALKKIRRYIYDGEVYQINFSQRFDHPFSGRPIDLFHWQNTCNPSPYAAYLASGDWSIVSASPELFLRIDGDHICTRPIKGTRPRVTGPDADKINRIHFTDLVESEKEQAELAMIVDLERNDLARVCIPGTRHVSQPRIIEEFPTVFHAVATIEGTLPRPGDPHLLCDILRAAFPGGSITGAPKIRAMEIIDELEPKARSVYTGAIGWISPGGGACLNIAIRTIILTGGRAYAQTGGGIVADSDPQAEWDETLAKARALLAGITAVHTISTTETV